MKMWSGIKSLDNLRSRAAAFSSGSITVTINELNEIAREIATGIFLVKSHRPHDSEAGYRMAEKMIGKRRVR